MREYSLTVTDPTGMVLKVWQWLPEPDTPVRAIVQISHGMCETAARYSRFAEALTASGYAVYAGDHRGHGRTAGRVDLLGDAGKDGFYWMRRNLEQIAGAARSRHEGVPCFLFAHSMGSFLAQRLMCEEHHGVYAGFILSGTNGPRGLLHIGESLASVQLRLRGPLHRSVLLNTIVFGPYNRGFTPLRTTFDWLSSDPEEVDRFIADPFCGAICTTRFFRDFFRLLLSLHTPSTLSGLVKDKPVYLMSGDQDPVGMKGQGVRKLAALYRKLGVQDLELRLYSGGRHEMLNEVNRDEVTVDVLDWLARHAPAAEAGVLLPLLAEAPAVEQRVSEPQTAVAALDEAQQVAGQPMAEPAAAETTAAGMPEADAEVAEVQNAVEPISEAHMADTQATAPAAFISQDTEPLSGPGDPQAGGLDNPQTGGSENPQAGGSGTA
ncbi:alpha/beta fold hydrolase [Paenibacillus sp. CN-4]|uniref:alpha/beta fold hydrolase n=1 Tax=Paenibacillus nanchangensis TaxID=3348343 RepID=UPI0039792394